MTPTEIRQVAESILPEYQDVLRQSCRYEPKGIFHSEMLAFCALIVALGIRHVIESGRARGQSTEIVARFLMDRDIAFDSIEFDSNSPDVALAERRLRPLSAHVNLLFGDARRILPGLLDRRPTLVLIDGPKSGAALQLAVAALRHPDVRAVCIHDVHKNAQPYRSCLEDLFPDTWFTDEGAFVDRFSNLDEDCWRIQRTAQEMKNWHPYRRGEQTMLSYSATLGVVFNEGLHDDMLNMAHDTIQEISKAEWRKRSLASRLASYFPVSMRRSAPFRLMASAYRSLAKSRS